MRVLHVINSGNPAGGGPITVARLLTEGLCAAGHSAEIATMDAPDTLWPDLLNVKVHALGPAQGTYGYAPALGGWLQQHRGRFDLVVAHGLWQYNSLAVWRALRGHSIPYVVFPHGMLDPWFKQQYPLKHLKKSAYWLLAQHRILKDAKAVLFTSALEQSAARDSFRPYAFRECVISLGTDEPPVSPMILQDAFFVRHPELEGKRLLLFLGRLHEKKGPDLLLRAFAQLCAGSSRSDSPAPWHLLMAGPADTPKYEQQLRQLAASACPPASVTWLGMLNGVEKWEAFSAADAFILPSHQENFALAVAEALACSVPVLISRQVNIWREIIADHAGLAAADTLEGTNELLVTWSQMSFEQQETMRNSARRCYETRFSREQAVKNLLEIGQAVTTPVMAENFA